VVEEKKQKFRAVNLTLRHGQELVDFRDRTNVDYFPVLPTTEGKPKDFIGHHDQNAYTCFYRTLHIKEDFTEDEEFEESSEQLVQSYAIYVHH
jgi:DNA-binding transcriptional regulator PaaX